MCWIIYQKNGKNSELPGKVGKHNEVLKLLCDSFLSKVIVSFFSIYAIECYLFPSILPFRLCMFFFHADVLLICFSIS